MRINELINVVEAIIEEKPFTLNYRLQKDGRLVKFVNCFNGNPSELHAFLVDVSESEPADFLTQEE